MIIHNKMPGGNIFVDKQEGSHIYLKNELRDTTEDWFYWAFCVEGAQGQEITFHFQPERLGYWGPAVSHDLVSWHWQDQRERDRFTYRFGDDEEKVYFAHSMLYLPQHFEAFARENRLPVTEFCKSRKGNSVPCIELGEGSTGIILTARHHACESAGSYVQEGVLAELIREPMADTQVLYVPFMDYDGVVEGDQGKSRYPHDHNRDYTDSPIYPEVAALIAYAEEHGCHYGFDFHSPWHWKHDYIYIMRSYKEEQMNRFSRLFRKEITPEAMAYSFQWDRPAFSEQEKLLHFNAYMNHRPENMLAFTLECTYAGAANNKVSQQRLRETGRCFGRALRKMMGENQELRKYRKD